MGECTLIDANETTIVRVSQIVRHFSKFYEKLTVNKNKFCFGSIRNLLLVDIISNKQAILELWQAIQK